MHFPIIKETLVCKTVRSGFVCLFVFVIATKHKATHYILSLAK